MMVALALFTLLSLGWIVRRVREAGPPRWQDAGRGAVGVGARARARRLVGRRLVALIALPSVRSTPSC
jgi:hypothetical protein